MYMCGIDKLNTLYCISFHTNRTLVLSTKARPMVHVIISTNFWPHSVLTTVCSMANTNSYQELLAYLAVAGSTCRANDFTGNNNLVDYLYFSSLNVD